MRYFLWPLLLLLVMLAVGCSAGDSRPQPQALPAKVIASAPVKVEAEGLHNVHRLADRLYSGGGPEGDEGFASLHRLGIKTILSVDGAKPDLAGARKHGLRYVHLPIGYDGVPRPQALRIARAVRDLPGPVYLHCHHGKHRGPAAAAVALLCLDESCAVEQAVGWLHIAGTDPHYIGLYAAPHQLRRPTEGELDRVPADFPEAAEVGGMARLMVEVDQRWDNLGLARKAGWKVPPGHPDIDPPHEALQLAELYREADRLADVQGEEHRELRLWLAEAEEGAKALKSVLQPAKEPLHLSEAEKAFRHAAAACARCHARYRDTPRRP